MQSSDLYGGWLYGNRVKCTCASNAKYVVTLQKFNVTVSLVTRPYSQLFNVARRKASGSLGMRLDTL